MWKNDSAVGGGKRKIKIILTRSLCREFCPSQLLVLDEVSSSRYREGASRVGSTSPPFRKKHEGQGALLAPAVSRES